MPAKAKQSKVPQKREKRNAAWRAHKKAAFLKAFKKLGGVCAAADAINVTRNLVWDWRQEDPEFMEAFNSVEEADTQELEAIARERAVEKSDLLMMFLLKGRKPLTYRDNVKVEHSGRVTVADLLLDDPEAKA